MAITNSPHDATQHDDHPSSESNTQDHIPIILLKTKSTPTDAYADYFSLAHFQLSLPSPRWHRDDHGRGLDGHAVADRTDDSGDQTQLHQQDGPTSSEGNMHISFTPVNVPVLEHSFNQKNLGVLEELILSELNNVEDGAEDDEEMLRDEQMKRKKYGGIIFTSQRAVEAFVEVFHRVVESHPHLPHPFTISNSNLNLPWIFYVVGPATSRALSSSSYIPSSSIHGSQTGTGEKLAQFILEHYPSHHHHYQTLHSSSCASTTSSSSSSDDPPSRAEKEGTCKGKRLPPLLFLVGETRRDIIPRMLQSEDLPPESRIAVDELVVYETGLSSSFETDFKEEMRRVVVQSLPPFASNRISKTAERNCIDDGGNEDSHVMTRDGSVKDQMRDEETPKTERTREMLRKKIWIVIFSPTGTKELLHAIGVPLDQETQRVKKSYAQLEPIVYRLPSSLLSSKRPSPPTNNKEEEEEQDQTKEKGREEEEMNLELEIYLATIGPTTRDHLVDTHGIHPHVVASRPTPEGVAEGITQFMISSSSSWISSS